jgi:hypothetical protein
MRRYGSRGSTLAIQEQPGLLDDMELLDYLGMISPSLPAALLGNPFDPIEAMAGEEEVLQELRENKIPVSGSVIDVYHRTSPANAKKILESKKMKGKEDGLFFSTSPDGEAKGFGTATLHFQIPAGELEVDDVFTDKEVHLRKPVKANKMIDVSTLLKGLLN